MEPNKKQPLSGNQPHKIPTVQQTTDLLKKLSEFQSKKEDIMKRLSEISTRMQVRLSESDEGIPTDAMPDLSPKVGTDLKVPPELTEVKFTRVRETNEPLRVEGGLYLFMPNSAANDATWRAAATTCRNHGMNAEVEFIDEGVKVFPGSLVTIPTGIKLATSSQSINFWVKSMYPGVSVVQPTVITPDSNKDEIAVTIKNFTSDPIVIEYGKIALQLIAFKSVPVGIEELLNSTFASWAEGRIKQPLS